MPQAIGELDLVETSWKSLSSYALVGVHGRGSWCS